jgi:hypothetical protein
LVPFDWGGRNKLPQLTTVSTRLIIEHRVHCSLGWKLLSLSRTRCHHHFLFRVVSG